MQLSEKHSENNVRDIVEWNVPLRTWNDVLVGVVAADGVGSASSSISPSALDSKGSASDDKSCRSWYRLRSRYFRDAKNTPNLRNQRTESAVYVIYFCSYTNLSTEMTQVSVPIKNAFGELVDISVTIVSYGSGIASGGGRPL